MSFVVVRKLNYGTILVYGPIVGRQRPRSFTSHSPPNTLQQRRSPRHQNPVYFCPPFLLLPFVFCLQVAGLRKVFPVSNGAKVAVKNTSLGIPRGECFGLLGINGAGKSTTLAILSGSFGVFWCVVECIVDRARCAAEGGLSKTVRSVRFLESYDPCCCWHNNLSTLGSCCYGGVIKHRCPLQRSQMWWPGERHAF